jgi:site-specific DNA recombinase
MSDRNVHALLYARVSTSQQANEGISLDAQERSMRQAAELAGFTEIELLREEGRSGKSIKGRPVLRDALSRLADGSADALFVTRIDRLARSTQDFLSIVDQAHKYNWRLVLLDLNLDTSSYQGRFVVTIMSALAEMERAIIAERQKDIHKDRREQGLVWGKDLGPKKRVSEETRLFITQKKEEGLSLHAIARELNAKEVPTGYGKKWTASSIKYVLDRNT